MPFPEDLNLFNVDEKIILNKIIVDNSKEYVLSHLTFCIDVCLDNDMITTLQELKSKIESIPDNEWNEMRSYFPCFVPYSDEDIDFIPD